MLSLDLYMWHEIMPLTGEEAVRKLHDAYRAWDFTAFRPHPNVLVFYDALMERYPPIESFDDPDDPRNVWMGTVRRSDQLLELHISWSARGVVELIEELAPRFELLLFDPQDGTAYLPPHLLRPLRLFTGWGQELARPDPDVVAYQLRKGLAAGKHVTLQVGSYCIVHSSVAAGPRQNGPGYDVEMWDGSDDRAYVAELDDVLAVFDAFARNDDRYRFLLDERGCARGAGWTIKDDDHSSS